MEEVMELKKVEFLRPKKEKVSSYEENKQKGDDFEKFVIERFNKKYFTLQKYRGDKYMDGLSPVSNLFPDLEIIFRMEKITLMFAVECKWHQDYYKGGLAWSGNNQFVCYKAYAKKMQMPVYVIIGLGGLPQSPEKIFIIPLSELNKNIISQRELAKYEKRNKNNFFWDEKNKQLL